MINFRKILEEGRCLESRGCNACATCMCALAEDAIEEIERLREALKRISEIEDQYLSGDWQEIDEARNIATSALEGSSYGNKIHKQGEA